MTPTHGDVSTESYWIASTAEAAIPAVAPPRAVDVAVLGAGIAGLTTAYLLVEAGLDVAVVEADELAAGVSGHTTAKVTIQHGLVYERLRQSHGSAVARAYGQSQRLALDWIEAAAAALDAVVDLSPQHSYVYTDDPAAVHELVAEADTAAALGLPATYVDKTPLPFARGGVRFTDQAQFHPRRWLLALAARIVEQGGSVVTGTRALDVTEGDPCVVQTSAGDIRARHVVVATHYPILDRGGFFARLEPRRDLVVAGPMSPEAAPTGMHLSAGDDRHSIRTTPLPDGRLLLIVGGEPHRAGERTSVRGRYRQLEQWARDRLGMGEVTYRWMAHDLTTVDGLPYIGRFHPKATRLWVATGFGHWGMTNGTLAGLILRDLITGEESPMADLYDPARTTVRQSAARFLSGNGYVAARFLGDRVTAALTRGTDRLDRGSGAVISVGRRAIAAYRDDDDHVHALSARCTHLGCLVTFNDGDRTWDCPCHGSRFGIDGSVREGPATRPLEQVHVPANQPAT